MWTIGSLLLLAINVFYWLITFPIRRQSKRIFRLVLVFVLFLAWLVPDGDKRFDTPAAKASLEALAKSLAVQLAPAGITVNCIAPGYTRKDESAHSAIPDSAWLEAVRRIPLNRIGTPDDSAALISFLLSPDAGFITGQTIHVDGGLTLA